MSTGEAEINPDGTTTFASYQAGDGGPSSSASADDGGAEDATSSSSSFFEATAGDMVTKRTDPAIYLGLALLIAGIFAVFYYRNLQKMRQKELQDLDFLSTVDGEKFNLKLPAAVDEYYAIKLKCEEQGWAPSSSTSTNNATAGDSPHHRVLAQALMKRCIADIPLVQHIQKESSGMNKLYAQSMCSVKQWRAYQAAESMVSTEVDEVRAEADEIEPGWSQVRFPIFNTILLIIYNYSILFFSLFYYSLVSLQYIYIYIYIHQLNKKKIVNLEASDAVS